MGSMITLGIGNLEVDWGKNFRFTDHSVLFQPSDVTVVDYHYCDSDDRIIIEQKEGYARPLGRMLGRLRMLGHDLATAEREYHDLWSLGDQDPENAGLPFARLCEMLGRVDVKSLPPEYEEVDLGKLFRRELAPRLGIVEGDGIDVWAVSEIIENFSAPSILVMLALNPANLDLPVVWRFADVVENGWTARADVVRSLRAEEQFLVITEGSSDVAVLRKALALLRLDTQDFYRFIDASDGYQFFGTGNLFKLAQGLVAIGILNRTVILYDNDTEGRSKLLDTERLRLPSTMRAIRLPDLEHLKKIPAIGPQGREVADINGRAAAIECYLDLHAPSAPPDPHVRWTSFNKQLDAYQGELVDKELYAKRFLSLRGRPADYDLSGLEAVLTTLEDTCAGLARAMGHRHTS